MIRLACPSCRKALRANDADAGKKTRCTGCRAILTVPLPERPKPSLPVASTIDDRIREPNEALVGNSPPTTVSCPFCRGAIVENPSLAARAVYCPHCQGNVLMPGTAHVDVKLIPVPIPGPMITFRCPHCQSMQTFAMEFAGQVVKCPTCNFPVQIPVPQGQTVGNVTTGPLKVPPTKSSHFEFGAVVDAEDRLDAVERDNRLIKLRRRNRGDGIVAMVLGLIGFLFILVVGPALAMLDRFERFSCAIALVGLLGTILGVVAVVTGSKALESDPNDGCAKTGYILGWICTVIVAMEILLVVAVFGLLFSSRRMMQGLLN